jgi:hypothetical protein
VMLTAGRLARVDADLNKPLAALGDS